MKVLFAVNNENISESIIKKYQQEYKEIISVKNVYYFNAIIKELQRDKSYDRIVISEDLQPFSNNNYDAIDKFIFEKMDNISDEATNQSGNDIPIILICTDRRTKSEPLLIKLFGIGVYNALIGKDRSITNVCELLAKPRTKKEAKVYYHIDSEDVDYKVENEGDVSEVEIQNILNYYKKLGNNEQKYVESFDQIASQYTDSQLRLIAKFLPLNVKAVLEANSMKYQEVVSFGSVNTKPQSYQPPSMKNNNNQNAKYTKQKKEQKKDEINLELIEKNLSKNKMKEPIIIPSAINTDKIKKMQEKMKQQVQTQSQQEQSTISQDKVQSEEKETVKIEPGQIQEIDDILENLPTEQEDVIEPEVEILPGLEEMEQPVSQVEPVQPKRRGRPKKIQSEDKIEDKPKRGRGRPKKIVEPVAQVQEDTFTEVDETSFAPVNLFELSEETDNIATPPSEESEDMFLPGLDDENIFEEQKEDETIHSQTDFDSQLNLVEEPQVQEPEIIHPDEPISDEADNITTQQFTPNINSAQNVQTNQNAIENINTNTSSMELNGLLTRDKKIVAFVGTSKNGTSFLVNNIAEMLSQKGINTAILDLTQNRNAYYIYTENEESLRKTAYNCIDNLRKGNASRNSST